MHITTNYHLMNLYKVMEKETFIKKNKDLEKIQINFIELLRKKNDIQLMDTYKEILTKQKEIQDILFNEVDNLRKSLEKL